MAARVRWAVIAMALLGTAAALHDVGSALARGTTRGLVARSSSAAPPSPTASSSDAWKLQIHGGLTQTDHYDNMATDPQDHVVSDDEQDYFVTIDATFQILPNGSLVGGGNGKYTTATWSLMGENGQYGHFQCSPTITAQPFAVRVFGQVGSGRAISWELQLVNAQESNKNTDCGAHYTAFGSTSNKIIQSINAVGGRQYTYSLSSPGTFDLSSPSDTTSGDTQTTIANAWQFNVVHDCGRDYGDDPSQSPYTNQFAAGPSNNLPTDQYGNAGGNACGPTSLAMLVDMVKTARGEGNYPSLSSLYGDTMVSPPANGASNSLDWGKAYTELESMGYDVLIGSGSAFIDSSLSLGVPVIASTVYSSKPGGADGEGHVILILGRTPGGDYIVDDPAGDYYANSNGGLTSSGHYGASHCGSDTIYPKAGLDAKANGRTALAVIPTANADPRVALIVGRFASGASGRPYRMLIVDSHGRRTGFLPNGQVVSEIPGTYAFIDPQDPTDPEEPSSGPLDPSRWPLAIAVRSPANGLKLELQGTSQTSGHAEISVFEGGGLSQHTNEHATLIPGATASFVLNLRAPVTKILTPSGARVRVGALASFRGTASDPTGIRSVGYTLQDARSGRYLSGRRFSSRKPVLRRARIEPTKSITFVRWVAAVPRLTVDHTYVLRVTALDRAGNSQVVFTRGANLARFSIKR